MALTVGTTVLSGTNSGGKTSQVVTLGSTTVGDLNIVELVGTTITTSAPTVTTPTGWTKVGEHSQSASSTPYVGIFWRIYQTGDGTTMTISWTGAMTVEAYCTPVTGADTSAPAPSSSLTFTNRSGTTTTDTAAGTTADAGYLWFGFCNKNGTTAYSAMSDTARNAVTYSSSITSATRMETASNASGHTYSKTGTAASSSIGFGWAYVVVEAAGGSTAATASGSISLTGSATAAAAGTASGSLSLSGTAGPPAATASGSLSLTGSATGRAAATASGSITLTGAAATPAQLWVRNHSGGTQYVAHRDGSWVANGEETLEGYTATAAYSSIAALEISVNDTSDGVWVCSHDSTTGRVFTGSNLTITSTAWSTFSPNGAFVTTGRPTTLTGGYAMRRLEEILDAFPDRIFVIDNKHNFNHASLIAVLQAHCPGRWLAKQYFSGYAWLNAASAYNAPCWAYFYPTDLGSLSTAYTNLATAVGNGVQIVYGIGDFSLTGASLPVQSDVTTFFTFTTAHSIMAWPHILSAASQKTTADGYAAVAGAAFNGYMMSNVANTVTGDATAAGTASGSLSLTGSAAGAGRATATGSISLTGTATGQAAATATGSISLTGTGTGVAAGTASGSISLAGTATARAAGTASGSITLTGTAVGQAVASAVGSITLTGSGTAQAAATAAGSISLTGSASTGGAVAGSGSITLTATAAALAATSGSGSITLTGVATGAAATIAAGSITLTATAGNTSVAAGTLSLTGTAAARADTTAQATITLTGLAAATVTVAGYITITGAAVAATPGSQRDLILTATTGTDRWASRTGTDRWGRS